MWRIRPEWLFVLITRIQILIKKKSNWLYIIRPQLMLMRLCKSDLRQSEKDSTANLEMQYPPPFAATLPSTDATFTIRPRAFLMRGRKYMVMAITPFMLTFSVLWKSSTLIHSEGPMGSARPALFTIPHSPVKDTKRQKERT